MLSLGLAVACFVVIHLFVSGTRLRDRLVAAIGEQPYMGLFSLASAGSLVGIGFAYSAAFASADNRSYWFPVDAHEWVAAVLVLIAFMLVVIGLSTPNPTAVQQDKLLAPAQGDQGAQGDPIKGILRITRHPFLWGTALWAATHLSVNGDRASMLLFSGFLIVAVAGTFSIDRKRARKLGAAWEPFASRTSNIPFAAILTGRNELRLREIGWVRPLVAVGIYLATLAIHPWLYGAVPLPWWP